MHMCAHTRVYIHVDVCGMGVDLCVDVLVPSPLNSDLHTKGPVWSDGFPESFCLCLELQAGPMSS